MPGDDDALPVLIARPSRETRFAVARLKYAVQESGAVVGSPRVDGFSLTLSLASIPAFDLSIDGRTMRAPASRVGDIHLNDLSVEVVARFTRPIDVVYFYIPRATLDAVADEYGVSRMESLHVAPGIGIDDAVVRDIGLSLLPSLQRIEQANRLFMDHVGMALLTHLAHTYGHLSRAPRSGSDGLTLRQTQTAKAMIIARLDGEISLDELARECGLSRSDFARSFRRTTGRQAHRWLLEQRVERARDLLLSSKLPLTEIARSCGFADIGHFRRVFFQAIGVTPGEWRRHRRS